MHIKRLEVVNFRGLERISLAAGNGLNVIAGPNAVGKTTILEAIRLGKSLLAQRFNGEAQQVLAAMGATQNGVISLNAPFAMLANDATRPIEIKMQLALADEEISQLKSSVDQLAVMALQTELARSNTDNTFDLAQYLSTLEGQNRLTHSKESVLKVVRLISAAQNFNLDASLDANTGEVRGADPHAQSFITFLERTISPNLTHFNYFAADRSLPAGEVGIQLGAGDVQQQVMSYIAQPQLKWQRVKQLIIQTMLFNENGRQLLADEFNLIFDDLLPGKKLSGVHLNEHSVLRVTVEDKASGKVFDIDSMSSGEKGLVLTFLTLRLSSKNGTIVMIDEPELHLNAAVCARIVKYMKNHFVEDKGLQLFVCSHAPEIVRDAFEDDKCKLFHLRSSNDLSPVLQQDSREVFEILNRLGNSTADVLFSRGSVFVEGDHDVAVLQAGYPEALQGFKVQPLGGRTEVEKEILKLQHQDGAGKLDKTQLFIFDKDRDATALSDTNLVKIYQLERYCIENYLLDETILYDLMVERAKNPPASRGSFSSALEEIAMNQLKDYVISEVYKGLEPENAGLRAREVRSLDFQAASETLWSRILKLQDSVKDLHDHDWKQGFVDQCVAKEKQAQGLWKSDWRVLASGKNIIDELYVRYEITVRKLDFKKTVISRMASARTESWRVLNSVLDEKLNRS